MHERAAVYCGTRNLYSEMVTAAKSLLYHNGADKVYFMIEDDEFQEPLPECITTINVSEQTVFRKNGPNYYQHWTYMALMRAAFTRYFPQYDKVLSLDCDTIVNNNIDGIWEYDLSGKYYAGVREMISGTQDNQQYCNFGVIMLNLQQLRDGTEDKVIELLNTQHRYFPEQEAFRDIVKNDFVTLPPEYNALWYSTGYVPFTAAKIIHYANHPRAESNILYRKYARKSWDDVMKRKGDVQLSGQSRPCCGES